MAKNTHPVIIDSYINPSFNVNEGRVYLPIDPPDPQDASTPATASLNIRAVAVNPNKLMMLSMI